MQTLMMNAKMNAGMTVQIEDEKSSGRVVAMKEQEREVTYMTKAQSEKHRVNRIRKARQSAEIIQRAWRRYLARKEVDKRRRHRR